MSERRLTADQVLVEAENMIEAVERENITDELETRLRDVRNRLLAAQRAHVDAERVRDDAKAAAEAAREERDDAGADIFRLEQAAKTATATADRRLARAQVLVAREDLTEIIQPRCTATADVLAAAEREVTAVEKTVADLRGDLAVVEAQLDDPLAVTDLTVWQVMFRTLRRIHRLAFNIDDLPPEQQAMVKLLLRAMAEQSGLMDDIRADGLHDAQTLARQKAEWQMPASTDSSRAGKTRIESSGTFWWV